MRTISEQELKNILDKHGKWRRSEAGGEKANLSSADLSSADLSSADLRCADLSSADLRHANLSFADLRHANLRYADLSSANLRHANLSFADLRYANLRYADLSFADLRYADLSFANLMVFQFRRHTAYFTFDGELRIGCLFMPITEWLLGFEEIGKKNCYDALEIEAYGSFIRLCADVFEKENKK